MLGLCRELDLAHLERACRVAENALPNARRDFTRIADPLNEPIATNCQAMESGCDASGEHMSCRANHV